MEMNQLEQFVAIANSHSMHEAASKLYLSQSTLSYNLKKLESELGCPLFVRSRNKLMLTKYGEILLRHAIRIEGAFQDLASEIEEEKRRDRDRIHIGCFSLLFTSFEMPQITMGLPEREFEVVICSPTELYEGLIGGTFDAVITPDATDWKPFKKKILCTEQAYVSVPATSHLATLESIDLASLHDEHFTIEHDLLGYSSWYQELLLTADTPSDHIDIADFRTHLKTKDALDSCNFITSFIMGHVRVNEVRRVIPIEDALATREIALVYPEKNEGKLTDLIAFLNENMRRVMSGNTFLPFYLFPEDAANLTVIDKSPL